VISDIAHPNSHDPDAPRRSGDDHALLVALIGDAIRTGLDSLRLDLGSRVERI
jgi:hypothetical protein